MVETIELVEEGEVEGGWEAGFGDDDGDGAVGGVEGGCCLVDGVRRGGCD